MSYTVVLGGARSGKSDLAARWASAAARPVTVLATAEAGDAEMAARIARHRCDRPAGWATVEEPLAVAEAVRRIDGDHTVVLDCVTLWVTNATIAGWSDERVTTAVTAVADALAARPAPAVVVTNEVGWGIVPADAGTRRFRDLHGRANRVLSERASEAVLVVAGRILPLVEPARHWGWAGV
jgi:adenosylcobinamide kinase / adenosylcobinamide-phosphate guanylyltransferase